MPPLSPGDRDVFVVVLTATVLYVAFHYLLRARDGSVRGVLRQRLGGALLLGAVPAGVAAIALPGRPIGLAWLDLRQLGVTCLFLACVLPITISGVRKPAFAARYPEMQVSQWDIELRVTSLAAWAIYLFGYELLFRGFLIFGIAPIVGPWTAIAISTGLYTLAHLEKDFSETAGCVPFGIAMGVLSSWSGSFLAPWLVHFAVAAVAETLVISSRARHETGLHATTKV